MTTNEAEMDHSVEGGPDPAGPKAAWSWLFVHPLFWSSVALLTLNDRVLKRAYPGLITGKVSDVAGVVMIAIVVVVASRRVWPALMLVAVAFGLLKTWSVAADLAVPVLGGRTLTDQTDLVALASLFPLGLWLHRRREHRPPIAATDDHSLERSLDHSLDRSMLMVLKIGGVVAAVLATSATSCSPDVAFERLTLASDGSIVTTTRGGSSAQRLSLPGTTPPHVTGPNEGAGTDASDRDTWELYDGDVEVEVGESRDRACTTEETCAEIRGLKLVEVAPDGNERTIVDLTDKRDAINSQADKTCQWPLGDRLPDVISDGQLIVVALGPVGAMVRTPTGEWLATGSDGVYPSNAATAVAAHQRQTRIRMIPAVALLVGLGFLAVVRARLLSWAIAVPLCGFVMLFSYSWTAFGGMSLSNALITSLTVLGIVLATWLLTPRRRPAAPWPPPRPRSP